MGIFDTIASFWQKEVSDDAEVDDGITALAVKGHAVVNDIVQILSVHVALGRDQLPREFDAFEALGNSFIALANRKDVDKTRGAIVVEWRALQKPLKGLLKRCAALTKEDSDVAAEQCRIVKTQLPELTARLDRIVTALASSSAQRSRKVA